MLMLLHFTIFFSHFIFQVIKDSRLFLMSSLFIMVDIVILAIWQSVDTMTSKKMKYLRMVSQSIDSKLNKASA